VAVTKDMLLSELQDLLRLTASEQVIANVRRLQAASSSVAEELKANAGKSRERQQLLVDAIRQTGGVPDVVGAAFGRAGAFVQTQVNQVQTLQGALLGDLALEHQLRERARYARTLAESLGYSQVIPVLDRLETAHTATIEWLETRLSEVGRTGTSALKATPIQSAVSAARRTVGAPFALAASGVNRASSLLGRKGGAVADKAGQVADRAGEAADSGAEQVLDLSGLNEQSEPFPSYSRLSGDSVMRHAADSDDVEHLREILAYEQAHKARKGVVQVVEQRLQELTVTA
jgi:bacterioferritin (cytochrome b1)